jgi:IS30 family transposase
MKYQHFSVEEREKIQEMRWQKASVRGMATALGRSPSSVSREIRRHRPPDAKYYIPRLAHERALEKRMHRGRTERLKNPVLREYVIAHLKLGWSPEQIAATAKNAVGIPIFHEAIYQFVYARVSKASHLIYAHQEDLRPYLPRHRRHRMHKGLRKPYRIEKGPLPSIDSRPKEADARERIGHWEDDCIVSRASPDRLKTINERVSGVVFVDRAADGTMAETNRIVTERMKAIPHSLRRTLTRDRGSENLGYEALEKELNIKIFFAHAYHSWERGSNENLNGLIRRFFPKKTDFRKISDEEIRMVEWLLNSRPRKRLGWKTPYQVFYERTGVALEG